MKEYKLKTNKIKAIILCKQNLTEIVDWVRNYNKILEIRFNSTGDLIFKFNNVSYVSGDYLVDDGSVVSKIEFENMYEEV